MKLHYFDPMLVRTTNSSSIDRRHELTLGLVPPAKPAFIDEVPQSMTAVLPSAIVPGRSWGGGRRECGEGKEGAQVDIGELPDKPRAPATLRHREPPPTPGNLPRGGACVSLM